MPLCFDHHKQLKIKKCVKNIGWEPHSVLCNNTQESYDLADKCPDGYVELTNEICIIIHPNQPFRSTCEENLVPFTLYNMSKSEQVSLFTYLRDYAPGEMFWLPAKQTKVNKSLKIGSTYSIDAVGLQWTLPAFLGENVLLHDDCPTCMFSDHEGCLTFYPTFNRDGRFNTSVINCSRKLKLFCLFRKTEPFQRLACPDGYVTHLMPRRLQTECLAIRQFKPMSVGNVSNDLVYEYCPQHQAYLMDSVQATLNFALLARHSILSPDDRCLFGVNQWQVEVNQSTFVEILDERGFRTFVNWDLSMGEHDFNTSTNHILTANHLGKWFWESNEVSCIVCSAKVELKMPGLELRYDSIKDKLTLRLIESDFLMTRFTNNLKFMCFAFVHNQYSPNLQATELVPYPESIYDIKLIGPGNYWCQAHVIYFGSLIESESLFTQSIVMSMMVEFRCRLTGCYDFADRFKHFLYSCEVNQNAVINPAHIRLKNVNVPNTTIEYPHGTDFVIIHYHVSVDIINEDALRNERNVLNLSDEMLTYYYVRQKFVLISNIQDRHAAFRIRSVNSTDFCLPSSISTLSPINWLGARINETIESVEGCIGLTGKITMINSYKY